MWLQDLFDSFFFFFFLIFGYLFIFFVIIFEKEKSPWGISFYFFIFWLYKIGNLFTWLHILFLVTSEEEKKRLI
jgi:hypothetical protein